MKKLLLTGAGAMALAASGYALAGPGMDKVDTDDNGEISRAEATAASDAMFFRMDANDDGKIDEADREARKRKMFDEIDANRDGKVTEAEMTAHREARMAERAERRGEKRGDRFARIDTDGDNALSFEEFGSAGEKMRGEGRRGGKHHEGRRGHGGGKMMMRMADTNNDGAVSAEEARAAALAHFDKMDSDGNAVVTEAEREAFRDQMRAKWKERRAQSE